jgi:RNA polymerase sigma factor (sigma-70 family)
VDRAEACKLKQAGNVLLICPCRCPKRAMFRRSMGTVRGVTVIHWYVELLTDTELLEQSSVSPEAFRDIFRRHFAAVHRYVQGQAGRGAADDLAAEVFVVAFERRGRYRPLCDSARPWLLGIATNLLRERRRSSGRWAGTVARLAPHAAEGVDSTDRMDARLDAGDARGEIVSALSRLRPEERDVLLLYALGDLTYAEIAVALGIPTGTVRSRLSRARAVLQRSLGGVAHLVQPIEDGSEQ